MTRKFRDLGNEGLAPWVVRILHHRYRSWDCDLDRIRLRSFSASHFLAAFFFLLLLEDVAFMPSQPLLPGSHSPLALHQSYISSLFSSYAAGTYTPAVLPYHCFGILPVIIYFLLPPRFSGWVRYFRFHVFAFYLLWSIHCLRTIRSPVPHASYGIGIVNAWSIIWLATLLVWRDGRTQCARIWPTADAGESTIPDVSRREAQETKERSNGTAMATEISTDAVKAQARGANGHIGAREAGYYWQRLPASVSDRLHWMADLGISMRAVGWSHAVRGLPPPPRAILSRLAGPLPPSFTSAPPGSRAFRTEAELFRHSVISLALCYISLDLLKTITMRDPYFVGFVAQPSPFTDSWFLARIYRSLLTLTFVGTALQAIFTLNPLFFAFVCGRERLLRLGIRAEVWNYPSMFGPFSAVWEHGLRGFWGLWWHQIFRLGFSMPVEWWVERAGWDAAGRDKAKVKVLGTTVAFVLSGLLHAAGSWTSLGRTQLWRPMLFFALQGVALMGEGGVLGILRKQELARGMPVVVRRAVKFGFVLAVLCLTSPLLCDDFARSAIWLFEPVPISLIRGIKGEGWWRWTGQLLWWHSDPQGRWWRSGLAF